MKVTVEIPDEQWARLEERARAEGCHAADELVEEAVKEYLSVRSPDTFDRPPVVTTPPPGYGVLSDRRGEELRAHVRELRRHWRDTD